MKTRISSPDSNLVIDKYPDGYYLLTHKKVHGLMLGGHDLSKLLDQVFPSIKMLLDYNERGVIPITHITVERRVKEILAEHGYLEKFDLKEITLGDGPDITLESVAQEVAKSILQIASGMIEPVDIDKNIETKHIDTFLNPENR